MKYEVKINQLRDTVVNFVFCKLNVCVFPFYVSFTQKFKTSNLNLGFVILHISLKYYNGNNTFTNEA